MYRFVFMKRIFFIVPILIVFLGRIVPVEAQTVTPTTAPTSAIYVGADASASEITTDLAALGQSGSDYTTFSPSEIPSDLENNSESALKDAIRISQANSLSINLVKNSDQKIDSLGYMDLLLTLGVDSANV